MPWQESCPHNGVIQVLTVNSLYFGKTLSVHIALPAPKIKLLIFVSLYSFSEVDDVGTGATDELEEEPSASQLAGKSPNFCVLLHGSLKVEGMVALVQLG